MKPNIFTDQNTLAHKWIRHNKPLTHIMNDDRRWKTIKHDNIQGKRELTLPTKTDRESISSLLAWLAEAVAGSNFGENN